MDTAWEYIKILVGSIRIALAWGISVRRSGRQAGGSIRFRH